MRQSRSHCIHAGWNYTATTCLICWQDQRVRFSTLCRHYSHKTFATVPNQNSKLLRPTFHLVSDCQVDENVNIGQLATDAGRLHKAPSEFLSCTRGRSRTVKLAQKKTTHKSVQDWKWEKSWNQSRKHEVKYKSVDKDFKIYMNCTVHLVLTDFFKILREELFRGVPPLP